MSLKRVKENNRKKLTYVLKAYRMCTSLGKYTDVVSLNKGEWFVLENGIYRVCWE